MVQNNLSILVTSWDPYKACWPPFCHGFTKYWPDCPFPVYFMTNFLDAPCGQTLKVGDVRGWSRSMRVAMSYIKTPYFMLLHEDYWIKTPISTELILSYLQLIEQDRADYILLGGIPENIMGHPYPDDPRLCYVSFTTRYRPSLRIALWRKSVFESLLHDEDSIWDFEQKGVARTEHLRERFLAVREPAFRYTATAVTENTWTHYARQYARREKIKVDFSPLHPMSLPERVYVRYVSNWRTRKKIRDWVNRILSPLRRVRQIGRPPAAPKP